MGATSLMLPPMHCEWLRMLKKRPANWSLLPFSPNETLLAMVASMSSVGELEPPALFAERDALGDGGIDVVGRVHALGVAARGGKGALGSRHVAGRRVVH